MIQHVRTIALPMPAGLAEDDIFTLDDPVEEELFEAEFDDSLDHLLKHAMKSTSSVPDHGRMWQQLSRRVQGPFGFAALEAPALDSIEAELLTSGGRVQQAPFVLNDRVSDRSKERHNAVDTLCDMLRSGTSVRSPIGSVGILS